MIVVTARPLDGITVKDKIRIARTLPCHIKRTYWSPRPYANKRETVH